MCVFVSADQKMWICFWTRFLARMYRFKFRFFMFLKKNENLWKMLWGSSSRAWSIDCLQSSLELLQAPLAELYIDCCQFILTVVNDNQCPTSSAVWRRRRKRGNLAAPFLTSKATRLVCKVCSVWQLACATYKFWDLKVVFKVDRIWMWTSWLISRYNYRLSRATVQLSTYMDSVFYITHRIRLEQEDQS